MVDLDRPFAGYIGIRQHSQIQPTMNTIPALKRLLMYQEA